MKEDSKRIKDTPESPASVSLPDSSQVDTPSLLIAKWKQVLATFPLQRDASARERKAHRLVAREVRRLQALEKTP